MMPGVEGVQETLPGMEVVEHQAHQDLDQDATAGIARPTIDESGPIKIRLTTAQAEALTDAVLPGELADGWPPSGDALEAAQEVITAALNGKVGHDDCLRCVRYAVDVADHALHGTQIRAARDAKYMILGRMLHELDGCHVARRVHPRPSSWAATGAVRSRRSSAGPRATGGYRRARDASAVDAAGRREIYITAPWCETIRSDGPREEPTLEDGPVLLKPADAARMLSISRSTLAVMERTGRLVPVDIGNPDGGKRLLRYRRSDVNQLVGVTNA
jgi:hypothetical protein